MALRYDRQMQYRWFNLPSAGTISVQFTHTIPAGMDSSDDAWRIKVPERGTTRFYFDTKSKLTDKGATCSGDLPSGEHYLIVEGLRNSNGAAISTDVLFNLTVHRHKLNVEVLDHNPQDYPPDDDNPPKYRSYLTMQEAFNGARSDCLNCRINTRDLTFQEDLMFDRALEVAIEGGKDKCFDDYCDVRYTTVQGSLTVRNGRVTVKRLKVF